jgi:hypothetical protein
MFCKEFTSNFGVNITGSVFLGVLGVIADSLNHLVFTMPFLPSEAEETKLLINQEMKDVLVFHYLPILWYRHPIPNDVREFWYYQRPDILEYMQTAYKDLDLQLLPNGILQEVSQKSNLLTQLNTLTESFSTNLVSDSNSIVHWFNNFFNVPSERETSSIQ